MNEKENEIIDPLEEPTVEDGSAPEEASTGNEADDVIQGEEPSTDPTPDTEETKVGTDEPEVVYRWSYAEQLAADRAAKASSRRRGVLTYAIVMTACFAVSFGILLATLFTGWDGPLSFGPVLGNLGNQNGSDRIIYVKDDYEGSGVLTEQEISTAGNPIVVGITVKTTLGGGVGTGIILTEDGYIATNSHVVNGAKSITVRLYNGQECTATLIGESEMDDLAVIKIPAKGLPTAKLGASSKVLVGDRVTAIGHPAGLEFGWTATYGRLSAVNRMVKIRDNDGSMSKKMLLLQTDADVNSGNSGGPLFNDRGEVIGIITMKLAGDYEGLGFAIPISTAVPLLNALMSKGTVTDVQSQVSFARATLGVTGVYVEKEYFYVLTETGIARLTEEQAAQTEGSFRPSATGVLVTGTAVGTDAVGKFQQYDVITAIDGKTIDSFEAMREYLYDRFVGDTVTLTYDRAGQSGQASVVLVKTE